MCKFGKVPEGVVRQYPNLVVAQVPLSKVNHLKYILYCTLGVVEYRNFWKINTG